MTPTFGPANLPTPVRRRLANCLGILALAVLYLLPGLLFSYRSVQEPWTLFRLARASLSLSAGHIVQFAGEASAYRGEHLGGELLLASLVRLTGLPLESLALLPLGALLLPVLTFAVVRVISRSAWLAVWLSLFSAWYYPRLYSHYAVQTYVWTDALFLCFVLVFWLWLQRPSALLSLLLVVLFAAAFLHYQTTPLWMTAAVLSGVLLARWRRGLYPPGQRLPSLALPLLFLVVYLQFDTVFYGDFLSRLRQEPVEQLLAVNFTGKVLAPLLGPLLGGRAAALGEFAAATLSPRLATWTTLLAIIGLSLPVLAWCLWKVLRAARSRQPARLVERVDDLFVWSLLLVFGVHALAYSVYGAVSLRLIDLVFPLLLPLILFEFRGGRRIADYLAPALAACALAGCLSYMAALRPDILAAETGQVAGLLPRGSRLLADANAFGGLLLNASQDGKRFDLVWLDADLYAAAAGRKPSAQASFDYLVTDDQGKPVTSRGWVFYQPWFERLQEIDSNPWLEKIYTSGALSVFQTAGKELPATPDSAAASLQPSGPVWLQTARLCLAVLWLLLIPGAVLGLLVLPALGLPVTETVSWPIILALAGGLSLSVHTFAGYLANFTVLGFGWQQPLVLLATGAALVFLLPRRLPRPPASTWTLLLLGLVVLAGWSLGAGMVDRFRSENRGPGLEFFLTSGASTGKPIVASAANHSGQFLTCHLQLQQPNQPIREVGSFGLPSGATHMTDLTLPGQAIDRPLSILLACDHQPVYSLHLNRLPASQAATARGPDDSP